MYFKAKYESFGLKSPTLSAMDPKETGAPQLSSTRHMADFQSVSVPLCERFASSVVSLGFFQPCCTERIY